MSLQGTDTVGGVVHLGVAQVDPSHLRQSKERSKEVIVASTIMHKPPAKSPERLRKVRYDELVYVLRPEESRCIL